MTTPTGLLRTLTLTLTLALALPAWSANAGGVFAPLGDANRIARIDAAAEGVQTYDGAVPNPHGLAASPDGGVLYAASLLEQPARPDAADAMTRPSGVSADDHARHHGGGGAPTPAQPRTFSFITKLDAATGAILARIDVESFTHHVTVTPDGRSAIGVQSGRGRIVVVDTARDAVERFVAVGPTPNYALVTRDGARVFVSSAGSNSIAVLDGRSWGRVATIPVGDAPEHMAFSPDERRLYVVNVGSDTLSVIDTRTLQEIARTPTGRTPHGVAYSARSDSVVVTNRGDDSLSVFTRAGAARQVVPLAPQPYHITADVGGETLWVSSRQAARLWRVEPETLQVRTTLELPGIAHQIVVVP